jgi:hypothetical protein
MPTAAKLEVTVKFSTMPTGIATDAKGWKSFELTCDDRIVRVTLRPKYFAKLEKAVAEWPSWVAALRGAMGPADARGFTLNEPNLDVFERKPKDASSTTT